MKTLKKLSITSKGLRYKLRIAFYLMSILPFLICIYIISIYILPNTGIKANIGFLVLISALIISGGFIVIRGVVDPVIKISSEAKKMIAQGNYQREIDIKTDDEIGDLSKVLNQLTHRIRENMEQLKDYGVDVQRKMISLSGLLQISGLITQDVSLSNILEAAVEKMYNLADSDNAYFLLSEEPTQELVGKMAVGLNRDKLLKLRIALGEGLLGKTTEENHPLILDSKTTSLATEQLEVQEKLGTKNNLCLPIYSRGKALGLLGIGNNVVDFEYKSDDINMLEIFAKQVTIALENEALNEKVKGLEIKDDLTGLYNEKFVRSRLKEEIRRAIIFQRPCSFVLLNVDSFRNYHNNFGELDSEAALKKITLILEESISEIDHAGRFGDNEFAIILPEKTKRQGLEIAEKLRKKVDYVFGQLEDPRRKLTLSGGISENPLDGDTSDELVYKAKQNLAEAKREGKNRIKV